MQNCFQLLVSISNAFQISYICAVFSQLLVLILYLCVDDSYLYFLFSFTGEISHLEISYFYLWPFYLKKSL